MELYACTEIVSATFGRPLLFRCRLCSLRNRLCSIFVFYPTFVLSEWMCFSLCINKQKNYYLASVGLYVTSYLSTGIVCWSTDVCHDIFTEVGFKNVTVIFSGAAEIEPKERNKYSVTTPQSNFHKNRREKN